MADTLAPYSAVLFDFDGTLADSYAAIAASVNHVRARRGHTALSVEEVKGQVVLRGQVPSHHTRQLALHGALELLAVDRFSTLITVG